MSELLIEGMTPAEVIEKLEVTHLSLGPVINLGTRNIRYRAKSIPGKVLDADFSVFTTGEKLKEWKIVEEEDFDDWMPIEAAKAVDMPPQKG